MQETPDFPRIQQRFNGYTEQDILGQANQQPIIEPEASLINRVFETVRLYLNDQTFRKSLPLQAQQNIEGQINAICDQFDQIRSYRSQSALPQNLNGIISNLSSYLEEIRMRWLVPYKMSVIEGNADTGKAVDSLQKTLKEAERIKESISSVLKLSEELVSLRGASDLANFYHRLYNGSDFTEEPVKKKAQKKLYKPKNDVLLLTILSSIFVGMVSHPFWNILKGLSKQTIASTLIAAGTLLLLTLFYLTYRFVGWFNRKYTDGYERAAQIWVLALIGSLLLTAFYSFFTIWSLHLNQNNVNVGEAIIKAILLLAPLYLVRFCARNFNASKHLSISTRHRAVSIRVFESFIKPLNADNKETYVEMVKLIFRADQTGYVTEKDGAGSIDTNINMPNNPLNR